MKLVVFTGAGAARADRIPSQADLFARFFSSSPSTSGEQRLREALQRFLSRAFFIDFEKPIHIWPSFEEVLGVIDLAGLRQEAIKEVLADGHPNTSSVSQLRRTAVLAMAQTVAKTELLEPTTHSALVRSLNEAGQLPETAFVTTNYDRSIERGLDHGLAPRESLSSPVDYGLDSLTTQVVLGDNDVRYPVYKIHGSLNWIACPVCDELQVKYASDVIARMINEPEEAACPRCGATWAPVIVPPTYYKDMANVFLSTVWLHAAHTLRTASDVVFCGYSFPDSDMHVKYLIKRAQLNRDVRSDPLRVTLVHRPPPILGTEDEEASIIAASRDVTSRYSRFLGKQHVRDAECSFGEFAADPIGTIERTHGSST